MVNNNPYLKILTSLKPPPDKFSTGGSDRLIGHSPLWCLSEIVEIVLQHNEIKPTVRIVTEDAIKEYEELLVNGFDLKDAISSIESKGRYRNSWWCKTSPNKDANGNPRGVGAWIPCDDYTLLLPYEHPATGYRGTCEHYFKFCKGLDGATVLFVSLHLS